MSSGARNNAAALRARRQTGAASRDRLLDAAEADFADYGAEGVSIRAINAAAGFGETRPRGASPLGETASIASAG